MPAKPTTTDAVNVNDAPTGSVSITGTATQNQVLTVSNTLSDADGLGSVGYLWQSSTDGTAWSTISGATASTFTLSEAQVGKQVRAIAGYTDGHGTAESVASAAMAAVANVNDAPTGAVSITGTATQNQVLTASNTLADADGQGAIGYQWQSSTNGSTWAAISGATGSTFTLAEAQVGKQVRAIASYTDGHGTAESVASTATVAVANVNDAPTGAVSITGTATQNQVLTVSNTLADADGLGAIGYQWQSSTNGTTWSAISGATASTFALTEAQVGKQVRAIASYTDGHGTAESIASAATAAVANVNDAPTGAVSIAGTATQNQVLTASNNLVDADGLGTIGYQWQSSTDGTTWSAINGATTSTFTLSEAQLGKQVRAIASYTDGHGTAESVASSATAAVANVNDAPTGAVSIAGTATQNQVMTASNTLVDADGLGAIGYQWQSSTDGTTWGAISGATASTFTLSEAQVGKQVRAIASYTDGHGTAESVASTATAAVANVNDAPTGAVSIAGTAKQNQVLTVSNTLADADGLGTIGYQWQVSTNGTTWSAISGATASTFTLTASEVGKQVRAIASYTDGHGTAESVASAASSVVTNVNSAPVVAIPLGNQVATEGIAFSLVLPAGGFTDPDAGDTLSYTAKLSSGAALPSWLTFNAATKTLSGMASQADLGSLQVVVTATDSGGLSANANFQLDVAAHAAVSLTGTTGNDVLTGFSGADTLNGGAGADQLIGRGGNDTYIVDNTGDVVTEALNEGTDLVQSSVTYTLAANVENLTLTGTTAINGTGNGLDNVLVGNSAANTLTGGAGNDTYYVSTGDTVTEAASAGTDTVMAGVTWTLGSNLENLVLTGTSAINATGNTLNNVLTGNSAANTLSGGTGADTMVGGAGNDTYVVDNVGDIVTESLNEGTDLVQSSVTYTLSTNVENMTLTGTTAINGTGNALDNILTGNSANNTLNGGDGNDTINGGTGNDTMVGGLGDDVYVVNVSTDIVTEAANAGNDTVQSAVTLTLATNVENLVLTGTTAINGTGNTLNNLVRGNTGVNTLNGGAGNDILEGGAGNDILTDTSGTALFNGGAGTDTMTGGAGAEIFLGGLGNDTYTTAGGNDIILFNKGDGQDTFATGGTGSDVISLGGGITYADLVFTKATNDLVLKIGATDQITFKNWYATTPSKPVANLQVMAEAMAGFVQGGSNPLLDQKVENFNFAGLVGAFDTARAANTGLTSWALTNALSSFQLAGSDTAALGGDLAYQYGKNGTLAGVGVTPALATLSDANLGTSAQALTPLSGLQTGSVRLS